MKIVLAQLLYSLSCGVLSMPRDNLSSKTAKLTCSCLLIQSGSKAGQFTSAQETSRTKQTSLNEPGHRDVHYYIRQDLQQSLFSPFAHLHRHLRGSLHESPSDSDIEASNPPQGSIVTSVDVLQEKEVNQIERLRMRNQRLDSVLSPVRTFEIDKVKDEELGKNVNPMKGNRNRNKNKRTKKSKKPKKPKKAKKPKKPPKKTITTTTR